MNQNFQNPPRMQQRYGHAPEQHVVNIVDDAEPERVIFLYEPRGIFGRKWRSSEKWIHAVLVVVLFFLFVLWWFSCTVKIVSIDGRIAAIRETEIPLLLNNSRIGIALLAAEAISPLALVPQNFSATNVTEVQLVNTTCQNFTVNNATEAQLMSLVPRNLPVNNVTEALVVCSQTQNLRAKNVTEAQLVSKSLAANNVTEIQLASKPTKNVAANKVTAAQSVSKRTKHVIAHKVTKPHQLVSKRSWNLTANKAQLVSKGTQSLTTNNVNGVEAVGSASHNLTINNVT